MDKNPFPVSEEEYLRKIEQWKELWASDDPCSEQCPACILAGLAIVPCSCCPVNYSYLKRFPHSCANVGSRYRTWKEAVSLSLKNELQRQILNDTKWLPYRVWVKKCKALLKR